MKNNGRDRMKAWSEQNQGSYTLMLQNIAMLVLVPRVFVMTACDNFTTSRRMIERALELKHIREYTSTQKVNSRQRKITSYGITPEGLMFLSEHYELLPESYKWIKEVCIPPRMRIKEASFNNKYSERLLNISGSAFIASMAGIEINPILVEEEQSQSINQVIKTAWEINQGNKQDAEPQLLIYRNAYEIKQQLKEITGEQNSFVAGRYIGRHTKQLLSMAEVAMVWRGRKKQPCRKPEHITHTIRTCLNTELCAAVKTTALCLWKTPRCLQTSCSTKPTSERANRLRTVLTLFWFFPSPTSEHHSLLRIW